MKQSTITYDIIGNIAILKFPLDFKQKQKKDYAKRFLKQQKNIKTVLEKTGKIKGRLRKAKTKFLVGENKRKTIYLENNCRFLLNVDETYFSPRLSNERKVIAEDVAKKVTSKKNKILVMFAGVAPFSIVIAKKLKQAGKRVEIVSSEINRKANKYAEENVKMNKIQDYVRIIQGDSGKLSEKLKQKFDFIVMPCPNLKQTFLDSALKLSRKGTKIYYYGFGDKDKVLDEINREAGKKIGKIRIRKAGEIAPYKFRWLAEFNIR